MKRRKFLKNLKRTIKSAKRIRKNIWQADYTDQWKASERRYWEGSIAAVEKIYRKLKKKK